MLNESIIPLESGNCMRKINLQRSLKLARGVIKQKNVMCRDDNGLLIFPGRMYAIKFYVLI